jgi:hypothetical protein
MSKIINLLGWIWQFPQYLLGQILVWVLDADKQILEHGGREYAWFLFAPTNRFSKFISGVGLGGDYILLRRNCSLTIRHEYGHCIQSAILGPLYLLVVGIVSASRNLIARAKRFKTHREMSIWYYNGFPEKWADELAGIRAERLKTWS